NRRYETANALSRDVQRYLADEAVEACPPSRAYLLRKFVRKHRAALLTTAAFVVVVIAALMAGLLAVKAEERRTAQDSDRAIDAETEATENLQKAEANLALAKKAVNDTFDVAKNHKLLQQPGMQPVRKLLLEKALPFYKRFRELHGDDTRSKADLAEQHYHV